MTVTIGGGQGNLTMQLECELWVPVLRYEVVVVYAQPRRATLFEEATIRLIEHFAEDQRYGALTLAEVCEQFLGIPDPDAVFRPAVQRLFDEGHITSDATPESLRELRLSQLRLTATGRTLLREGYLPAERQTRRDAFWYDPVAGSFREQARYADRPGAVALPPVEPRDAFPATAVRSWYRQRRSTLEWLGTAEVQEVSLERGSVAWRQLRVTLVLEDGKLSVQTEEGNYAEYLSRLPAETLRGALVEPVFAPPALLRPWVQQQAAPLPPEPKAQLLPIGAALDRLRRPGTLLLLPPDFPPSLAPATGHRVVIRIGASAKLRCTEHDGCYVVHAHGAPDVPGLLGATEQSVVCLYRASARAADRELSLYVAGQWDSGPPVEAVRRYVEALAEQLITSGFTGAAAARCLVEPDRFWELAAAQAAQQPASRALELLLKLCRQAGATLREEADPARTAFARVLDEAAGTLSVQQAIDVARRLQRLGIIKHKDMGAFFNRLERRTKVRSVRELAELYEAFRALAQDWAPVPLEEQLNEALARDLCEQILSPALPRALRANRPLEQDIVELNRHAAALNAGSAGGLPTEELADRELERLLRSRLASARWRSALHQLLDTWHSLIERAPLFETVARGTVLARLVENAHKALQIASRLDRPLRSRPLVLDTSALLANAQLVSAEHRVVIPTVVLDELDRLKDQPRTLAEARRAIRAIEQHRDRIEFATPEFSVMPPDAERTPDNAILAVALRYVEEQPVLVSEDVNLRNKAAAVDIQAISVPQWQEMSDSDR